MTEQDKARAVLAKHGLRDGFNLPELPGYMVMVDPETVIDAVVEALAYANTAQGEGVRDAYRRAAEIALTFRPKGPNARHFVDVLVCDIAKAIQQEADRA
ncbi:MAG: hypothetical protein J7500_15540 [Sphingomonas sp.]|uniref:hypothetical protein n=1 Tax=Sphingomonas sp. TaxID=28214 RepID=UPI001B074322|nr:hypothetical protein [Sphingomonas sp.]MBO9624120.1 hypothetical protein [Sphingomonas sp.]